MILEYTKYIPAEINFNLTQRNKLVSKLVTIHT